MFGTIFIMLDRDFVKYVYCTVPGTRSLQVRQVSYTYPAVSLSIGALDVCKRLLFRKLLIKNCFGYNYLSCFKEEEY